MRIGNAQDANGRNYITGISAVNDGSDIASDIVSIRNGSGISLSSSMDGGLVVNAVFTPLVESISKKVERPPPGTFLVLCLRRMGTEPQAGLKTGANRFHGRSCRQSQPPSTQCHRQSAPMGNCLSPMQMGLWRGGHQILPSRPIHGIHQRRLPSTRR